MHRQLTLVVLATIASLGPRAQARGDILGSAEGFAVLGGSTVTNTGASIVNGNVGVWPGTSITGFPPGQVTGTTHLGDPVAHQAQLDAAAAYNVLAGMALTQTMTGVDLGGLTLGPGVYHFASSAAMSSLPLTLDAGGDPNALFVFQIATTLTTATNASVLLINSGRSCNVYWQVGTSATLGTGTTFKGSILAHASITVTTGASIPEGRALAQVGGVTMDTNNSVSLSGCALAAGPRTPAASAEMNGRTTITFIDPTGHPVMLQRTPAGAWTTESLDLTASPVPLTTNRYATQTWVDERDGKSYVAITSSDGLFVVDTAVSPLRVRNLTTETRVAAPGASAITGASTVFKYIPDGSVNIIGINATGEVVRYYQTGAVSGNQADWGFMNITTSQLIPNGIATPAFVSNLVAYPTTWGGLNVAGLVASGDVYTVWWAPGMPNWLAANLSQASGTPPLNVQAGLTAFVTSWDDMNVVGLDEQGHVIIQWWSPEFGAGGWRAADLTQTYGGAPLSNAALSSFVLPWDGLNIAGISTDGDLICYWWIPGLDEWIISSIQDVTAEPNPARLTGGLIGNGSPGGVASIIGESAAGNMVRYWWQPGEALWHAENVSQDATHR